MCPWETQSQFGQFALIHIRPEAHSDPSITVRLRKCEGLLVKLSSPIGKRVLYFENLSLGWGHPRGPHHTPPCSCLRLRSSFQN